MRISIFSAVRLHDDSAYVLHAHYLGDVPNKHYILAGYDKETRYISTEKKNGILQIQVNAYLYFFFFLSSKSKSLESWNGVHIRSSRKCEVFQNG